MAIERWGSLSVRDHLNTDDLVTNILLYDRLVIPVPDGVEGLARWNRENWEPHRQREIIAKLGELAVTRKWDTDREQAYEMRRLATDLDFDVKQVITEVRQELPYHNTRMVLAQEEVLDLPVGVADATVVAGYNSAAEFRKDCGIDSVDKVKNAKDAESQLAVVFHNELIVPAMDDPDAAFRRAIDLSLQDDYRTKRQEYYEWQRQLAAAEVRSEVAVKEMGILIKEYNHLAEKALGKVRKKFAFTVGGIALNLAGALLSGNPLPAVGALLTFVSYKTFDSRPMIAKDRFQPAAMFHDAREALSR